MADDLGYVSPDKLKAALRRLRDNPECGKPLGDELRGCRSIRVEGENRLVYRVSGDSSGRFVEVIAISRRRARKAYETATKRV